MLRVYNSLCGSKEEFTPIEPGKVRMYVCGMTVYDYCHLGHARVLVVFDVIVRYLRSIGNEVHYVRNVTDIDDKIIQRSRDNGEDFRKLTRRFTQAMHEDAAALGVLPPDDEPYATDSMERIIDMVSNLVDKGYAYQADNGDVYYDVSRFNNYGELSGEQPDALRAGARIEVDEAKDDPLDFVLWKAAKPDEPSWPSPWGDGRPGWHIECSAMSTGALGAHFDIHGGGMDLKFPHHENEIAQSEGATGQKFVNYWIHNGFVQVDEEKMSKSLGNFFTVREVLTRYRPEEIRYFILSSHYRSPLNYSDDNLDKARSGLARLYTALRGLPDDNAEPDGTYLDRYRAAMDDDFNTPEAIAVMFDLANELNRARSGDPKRAGVLAATLRHLGSIIGLLQSEAEEYLQSASGGSELVSEAEIEQLIDQRNAARRNKNWAESDRIRDHLNAQGVILEDGADGTTWRRG